jgi:hypothetical protein
LDSLADVIVQLLVDKGKRAELEDRTIRLIDPASADPSFGVLGVLGMAQDESPVGAASHAPEAVVAGVWVAPNLYLARWTGAARWVVDYRLPASTKLDTYVRAEGRIPTHLENARWSAEVPEAVSDAFAEVGISLDDPPFPPPPKPAPRAVTPKPTKRTPAAPRGARAPREKSPARPRAVAAKPPPRPTAKLCPSCHMQKAFSQFVPGSELCADCR